MRKESAKTLQVLKNELKFVHNGGYRVPLAWRAPLFFEDSPTCPKRRCSECVNSDCVLMDFVPSERLDERVPCRHIPLNGVGETLDSLYRTGTNDEIEQTLEAWLLQNIDEIEEVAGVPANESSAQEWFQAAD